MMSTWPTQYTPRDRVYTVAGSREHVILAPRFDEAGNYTLEPAGVENRYDEIQSHKDSCDINLLIKRYQAGDETALLRRQAMFMDVTEMPKTYVELLNMVTAGEQRFMALPLEVREQFGNSYHR